VESGDTPPFNLEPEQWNCLSNRAVLPQKFDNSPAVILWIQSEDRDAVGARDQPQRFRLAGLIKKPFSTTGFCCIIPRQSNRRHSSQHIAFYQKQYRTGIDAARQIGSLSFLSD
jgi:hypothetical protein